VTVTGILPGAFHADRLASRHCGLILYVTAVAGTRDYRLLYACSKRAMSIFFI
jgi:hypothetical protein